jgi:CrcB protein
VTHDWDPLLPLSPDLDADEGPVDATGAHHAPLPHGRTVIAVLIGGFFGGLARYGIALAWPTPVHGFPSAILVINTAGCFALALVLVAVTEVLPPTAYLRPLLGTGFCGGFTTFSSLAVADVLLLAHGHAGLAVAYLLASVVAGVAATALGIAVGTALPTLRPDPSAEVEPP